jgi:hypothetical protein
MVEVAHPAKNKLKALINAKQITRYQFWKDTGLSQNTAYRLYDDPLYIPGGNVINKIYEAYGWQPGQYLVCEE